MARRSPLERLTTTQRPAAAKRTRRCMCDVVVPARLGSRHGPCLTGIRQFGCPRSTPRTRSTDLYPLHPSASFLKYVRRLTCLLKVVNGRFDYPGPPRENQDCEPQRHRGLRRRTQRPEAESPRSRIKKKKRIVLYPTTHLHAHTRYFLPRARLADGHMHSHATCARPRMYLLMEQRPERYLYEYAAWGC